jgi:fatty acid desaturase
MTPETAMTTGLRAIPAKPRRVNSATHSYTALAHITRTLGLQGRTRWFYALLFTGLMVALGGAATGTILLDTSWLVLLMAGALGLIFTQFAFLGHEASHRQVLTSGPANDRLGRVLATLFVGISYSWWMNKHTRHHANPNKIGKDPDIEIDTISFHEESAATRTGLMGWITQRQGWLFFPLLLAEGLNLHLRSFQGLITRRKVEGRWLELGLLGARFACYLAIVFWLLPLGMAFAFLGVQRAAGRIRPLHGLILRPQPRRHAHRPERRQARLPQQAGAHGAQRQRWLVGDSPDGRTQLPNRAPPLPQHAPAPPRQDAAARPGALPSQRRALHRDIPAPSLGHRGSLPQPRRPRSPQLLSVPHRRTATRPVRVPPEADRSRKPNTHLAAREEPPSTQAPPVNRTAPEAACPTTAAS